MNSRPIVSLRYPIMFGLATALAPWQPHLGVCAPGTPISPSAPNTGKRLKAMPAASGVAPATPVGDRVTQASSLISEALGLAEQDSGAQMAAVRGAAALLPRLDAGKARTALTSRWINLALSPSVARATQAEAFSSFFDAASMHDAAFARMTAASLPDAAARSGAYVDLSQVAENTNWQRANEYASMALAAARQEPDTLYRAKALTFVADRIANVNPETRPAAVNEAARQVRSLPNSYERDYLLANIVGTAAKFDFPLARRMAGQISDPYLKGLAGARVNLAEISQTTLMATPSDRIAALAKAAARYDTRALPILLQLPPQADVLKTISHALPPVYPTASPMLETSLLERMWRYASAAPASVYRDELQSRLARLMVLHDPWLGRSWGKQLSWKGGRIQVGAFLHNVMAARRSAVNAAPLQDLAERNINRAILQARTLPTPARVEALLLIAGQILG